jgi:D-aminopeptidase
LVQTNFGGNLTIAGAPVGAELPSPGPSGHPLPAGEGRPERGEGRGEGNAGGSCVIVVATDAPLDARNLKRMAARAIMGFARTGAAGSNGSGDYAIAFSTKRNLPLVSNDAMSPLFEAAIEATEEAIVNSLLRATTITGNGHTATALPIDAVKDILRRHALIR